MVNNSSRRQSGSRDQKARAALAPLVRSGHAVCWRCGLPIAPTEQWDAGHLDDLGTGGHPAGKRVPEHTRCNRSAGGRLGHVLRSRPRRRLAEWLAFFDDRDPKDTPDLLHFSPNPATVFLNLPDRVETVGGRS